MLTINDALIMKKFNQIVIVLLALCSYAPLSEALKQAYPGCRNLCVFHDVRSAGYRSQGFCYQWGKCNPYLASTLTSESTLLVGATSQKTDPVGIDYDLNILSKISKINPYAAIVLLNVHTDHRLPQVNLLHGMVSFSNYETSESVQNLIDDQSNGAALNEKKRPTPENRFIQVRWVGQEMPGNKLLVTFVTEWIDETAEKRSGHIVPTVEVEFSTTSPYQLLNWRTVK